MNLTTRDVPRDTHLATNIRLPLATAGYAWTNSDALNVRFDFNLQLVVRTAEHVKGMQPEQVYTQRAAAAWHYARNFPSKQHPTGEWSEVDSQFTAITDGRVINWGYNKGQLANYSFGDWEYGRVVWSKTP